MTANTTNYKISNGSDLNTVFAPLYLDTSTKDLVTIRSIDGRAGVFQKGIFGDWTVLFTNSINSQILTINTNINAADGFEMIVCGGGAGGRLGSASLDNGGGGGGGFGRFYFSKNPMPMGLQFNIICGTGLGSNSQSVAGTTSITDFSTSVLQIQATGGGSGEVDSPGNADRAASGVLTTVSSRITFYADWGTFNGSQGGSGIEAAEGPGLPTAQNINQFTAPWGSVLRFCGGGGGTSWASGGSCSGAGAGNGIGGAVGVRSSQAISNSGGANATQTNINGYGGGGGGAGGASLGSSGAGGTGANGCIYMYWRTRP